MSNSGISLAGRTALVTGGSRGIGREVALTFGRAGAQVGIVATNEANARAAAEAVAETGADVETFIGDVSDADRVDALVKEFVARFGRIDVLVNNAGLTRDNLLLRMKEQEWDRVLEVNLKGAFLLCKAAARPMMKNKRGSIINVSSVVGLTGNPGQANYAASKAGLIALTRSVALELGSRGIRVNALCPGFVETEMTSSLDDATREAGRSRTALGRFGAPAEIADAALYLASDLSSYVTGSVLVVDGGLVAGV